MWTPAETIPEQSWWPRPPFTVDTLFELADDELRYEVMEGSLIVTPRPAPPHDLAAERLWQLLDLALPTGVEALTASAVRMPGGDGLVPDLMVTTGDADDYRKGIPAELVHTVIEVVSPTNASDDRVKKPALYASAGIPCYWRVELRTWRGHLGQVPAIVIRLLGDDGEWHTTTHPAGQQHRLPLLVNRVPTVVPVELDPAVLVGRRS